MILNIISFLISVGAFMVWRKLVAPVSTFETIIGLVIAFLVYVPAQKIVAGILAKMK